MLCMVLPTPLVPAVAVHTDGLPVEIVGLGVQGVVVVIIDVI